MPSSFARGIYSEVETQNIDDETCENAIIQQEEDSANLLIAEIEFRDLDQPSHFFPKVDESFNPKLVNEFQEEEKDKRKFNILIFSQLVPGAGLGIRSCGEGINYEVSLSAFLLLGTKGSFILLKPLGKANNWYAGAGIGLFNEVLSMLWLSPYVPVVFGYKGKRIFTDIGLDFTQMFGFSVLPNFRFGFYF